MTLPNVDGLAPKSVIEMYSYDHDLAMFVAIGTGTVSNDGSTITSDPGVGVVKAGWHCGGDPNTAGTVADCPTCKICDGISCVADPMQNSNACTANGVNGVCCNGNCVKPSVDVLINNTATNTDDITALNPAQTIPVQIVIHSQAGCPTTHVTLSAMPAGRVSLSQTDFDLADGATATATITPLAVSASANDVMIIATAGGVQVGNGMMTVVNITIPKVRNTDTPMALPDRIPPTVTTPLQIMVMPDLTGSGQSVVLMPLNNNATNGDLTLGGGAMQTLMTTTTVNLSGTTQTAPGGNAGNLNLVAQVRGQNAVQSSGFSVAAIPIGIVEALIGPVTAPNAIGLIVSVQVTSDSGSNADLSQCQFSEQIQVVSETGSLIGLGGGQNSSYLTCVGTFSDTHSTGTNVLVGPSGTQAIAQTHIFKDMRLGTTNIPIDMSGFSIDRNLFQAPPPPTRYRLTTSKVGAGETANGYTSSAGQPSVPMTVTQP